jgi:taurine dioxygenase
MSLRITPLTGAFAACVEGFEVRRADDAAVEELKQLVHRHGVVVIPGQPLHPDEQLAFTTRLGEVFITPYTRERSEHPGVLALPNVGKAQTVTEVWHHDATYLERPPWIGVLTPQVLPPAGGDTMFADQRAAFRSLSAGMQGLVMRLRAVHWDALGARAGAQSDEPPRPHPAVIAHPVTGEPALYLSKPYVSHFEDMTERESAWLRDHLVDFATEPEFVYRHHWSPGDVLLWDQRCCMHYAVHDHGDAPRVMHRTTVGGPVPAAYGGQAQDAAPALIAPAAGRPTTRRR